MKPRWLLVVSFKTELLSEYSIHKGYREDLKALLPRLGLLQNRMIIDNDIYVDLNEVGRVQKILLEDIIGYADEAYAAIESQSERLLTTARRVSRFDKNLSNKEILGQLKDYLFEYQRTLGAIGIPTIIDLTIESVLKAHLRDSKIHDVEEAFGHLAFSYKPVGTNQESTDLLELAGQKKKGTDITSLVERHAEKYGWLHSTLFLGDEYTPDKILREISHIHDPAEEDERIQAGRKKQAEEAENIISQVSTEEGKTLARFLQKAVYFRTARLEWMNEACFIVRPLMYEISVRLGLSFNELLYMYPNEIYQGLETPSILNRNDIKERQKGYAFISDDTHEYALFTGAQLKEWKDRFSNKSQSDEVKGLVACRGKVRGIVVVIKDRSELSKVNAGDIIVTPLTTPDFIVAMKKAGAIITDLGGMTSHAAIVSRELGVPCIVGTQNATQVLSDGDLVEVDAENGIVRRI